jgi:hypothetical protein
VSNLRDEIEDFLVQYAIRMESPIIASTATGRFADELAALIREALLSDKAVAPAVDEYERFPHIEREKHIARMRGSIALALDAALGKEG